MTEHLDCWLAYSLQIYPGQLGQQKPLVVANGENCSKGQQQVQVQVKVDQLEAEDIRIKT